MTTGRVTSLRGVQATGRVTKIKATASQVAGPVGRITAVSAVNTSQATGRLTEISARTAPPPGVIVPALANLEPGVLVTVAPVVGGVEPTSFAWSCNVPGVAFAQDTTSGRLVYKPPATRAGVSLVWTCTVSYASGTVTGTAQHAVLPHAGGWMVKGDRSGLYPVMVGAPLPGAQTT